MKKIVTVCLILIFVSAGITFMDAAEDQTKKEIVKVNYIKPSQAAKLLNSYISPKGNIRYDDRLGFLTIEDIPEIVDMILEALKMIDIKPVEMKFTVDLILGSMDDEPSDVDPSDPVLKELQKILSYKTYKKIGSSFIRVQENTYSEHSIGGTDLDLMLDLHPKYIREGNRDTFQVDISLSRLTVRTAEHGARKQVKDGLIHTALSLKNKERAVVGVSKLNGGKNGLILILSGEILK